MKPVVGVHLARFGELQGGSYVAGWFEYVIKGYDALINYKCLIEVFHIAPIIPIRAIRRGAKKRRPGTEARTIGLIPRDSKEWKSLYARRTAVERVFGRLKEHRRLEQHCYRGLTKLETHCLRSVLTLQAKALVQVEASEGLRDCLRKAAQESSVTDPSST